MQSVETVTNLQKVLNLLDPALELEEMLTKVSQQLVEMFQVDHCGVLLFGAEDVEGVVIAEYPSQDAVGLKVPLTDYPLIEQLKIEREPIAVFDAQRDPFMGQVRHTMQHLGIQSILIIPLFVKDKLIGGLGLDIIKEKRTFVTTEMELAHAIGNQIAVAIDYASTLKAVEENHRQTKILREIDQLFRETLDLNEVLPLILEQLEKVLPVDGSSIYLLIDEYVQLKARCGAESPFKYQQIVPLKMLWGTAEIVKGKQPIVISDVSKHPEWDQYEGSPVKSWLGVPLIANGEIVGALNVDGYTANRLNESHIPAALAFANQSALAIYNARLYSQAKKRSDLLASVHEIGVRIATSFELEDILQAVITSALALLDAGQARIYLYDEASETFTLRGGLDQGGQLKMHLTEPRKGGLTAQVATTGKSMTIPDIFLHPLYRNESGVHGFRAIGSVPLKTRDKVVGVLNVFYAKPHHFPPEEMDALQLLATQTAVALENARLYQVEQERMQERVRRAEQWQQVQEISSTLNRSLNLDEILNTACQLFIRLLDVDHCGVVLMENDHLGRLVAEYPQRDFIGLSFPVNYPAFQQTFDEHDAFVSDDVATDERLGPAQEILLRVGVKSVVISPLVVRKEVIGLVGVDTQQELRRFTEAEINIIRVITDQMAIAVANAHTYQAEYTAREHADTLREVAAILGETLDLREVLNRILAQLERVVIYDTASIILREAGRFRVVENRSGPDTTTTSRTIFSFAQNPHFQAVTNSRQLLVISNTAEFEGWPQAVAPEVKSWIGIPLMVSDQLIGMLTVEHHLPDYYQPRHGELIQAFADLAAVALENARLYEFEVKQVEQELHIARQIQRGFFPSQLPQMPGWEIAAICKPARETGGDFYTFVERDDDALGIVVGDVSGKSIPAAMLMAGAHSLLRSKGSDHRSPAKVIREANRLLYDDVPDGAFVAASYALLSPTDNRVWLSSGGQVAPFLVPANGKPIDMIEPPGDRLPLGVINDVLYEEMCLTMNPGDLLIFYTDGLIEEHDQSGSLFGFDRVKRMLNALRGKSPQTVLKLLFKATREFARSEAPHDDITVVIVQRTDG